MTQRGFMEPRKLSPTGLTVVIAMHAAALGALAFLKAPEVLRDVTRTIIYDVTPDPIPEPDTPPPPRDQVQPRPSVVDQPRTIVDTNRTGPALDDRPVPDIPAIPDRGNDIVDQPRVEPVPEPVRVAAEFDPRYAGDQQPPYPATEERAGREGSVRVRVTVGTDGRVKGVQRLSATSEAFWRATERHAMARWRFRPATVDGRPIESSKTLTIYFRLQG